MNEAERLRGLLARLEWAGTSGEGEWGTHPVCPVCERLQAFGHDPGCWLAAELHPKGNA